MLTSAIVVSLKYVVLQELQFGRELPDGQLFCRNIFIHTYFYLILFKVNVLHLALSISLLCLTV